MRMVNGFRLCGESRDMSYREGMELCGAFLAVELMLFGAILVEPLYVFIALIPASLTVISQQARRCRKGE